MTTKITEKITFHTFSTHRLNSNFVYNCCCIYGNWKCTFNYDNFYFNQVKKKCSVLRLQLDIDFFPLAFLFFFLASIHKSSFLHYNDVIFIIIEIIISSIWMNFMYFKNCTSFKWNIIMMGCCRIMWLRGLLNQKFKDNWSNYDVCLAHAEKIFFW
jgi:hypothetical protein